jgi:hypothetical protein
MRGPLFSIAAASVLMAGAGLAHGQSTTTTTETWTSSDGNTMREYSTTQHYRSFDDPAFSAHVGVALPGTVTVYPLPSTVEVPSADRYSYTIVNNTPVGVDRTTRQVVHTWDAD